MKASGLVHVLALSVVVAVSGWSIPSAYAADEKIHVTRAADLPRFTYPVTTSAETLVRDKEVYQAFAIQRRADLQSVFDKYVIDDNATLRGLLSEAGVIDFLLGRYDDAEQESIKAQQLQDKPSAKLMSGLEFRAVIDATRATGSYNSDAFKQRVSQNVADQLKPLPYAIVENSVKELQASRSLLGEGRIIGNVRDTLQPVIDQNHALSNELAPRISLFRYALEVTVALGKPLANTYQDYLTANKVVKPDIWEARNVALPPDAGYANVNIAVWDSGVDTSLFAAQEKTREDQFPVLAYDMNFHKSSGSLAPLGSDVKSVLPEQKTYLQGFSDLTSNIQSPAADRVKEVFSTLPPDQYKLVQERLGEVGDYSHGTHVAGISTAGNPYARLVVGRLSFDWKLIPNPCPSKELTDRIVKSSMDYVNFFKAHHVRVVNMSWGGDVAGYERQLEQCGIGKTAEQRKAMARELFDHEASGLKRAIASAPGILFVAAAGNSDNNAAFIEDIPAGIVLPNLIAVGAVDQAGDEASFTSYGPTVKVDANGYQVKSIIPGGDVVAFSGTSMAAPQVTNLAGKLFAIDPKLTPEEVIALIEENATKSDDGRRNLIDPARTVQQLKNKLTAQR
jgi:subtilisin family serine protease